MCAAITCKHTKRSRTLDHVFQKQPLSLATTNPVQCVHSGTEAVQQQRYAGTRSPSSRPCVSCGVCVWLVHSSRRRSNHNSIFPSNATMKHTSSDRTYTRCTKHTAAHCFLCCCSKKNISSYIQVSLTRLCSPFRLCDAPGISSQTHIKGEPCTVLCTLVNAVRIQQRAPTTSNRRRGPGEPHACRYG